MVTRPTFQTGSLESTEAMHETSKANPIRAKIFEIQAAFRGHAIDIGAGDDPLMPTGLFPNLETVEAFDWQHGDAQTIDQLRPHRHYDLVYASHCLEHMRDPIVAFRAWWKLVKPGGGLFFAVPHENLYEQGHWPSRFNPDHKTTWRLCAYDPSWSPVSLDLEDWIPNAIPDAVQVKAISQWLRTEGYDFSLLGRGIDQTMRGALAQIDVLIVKEPTAF